MFLLLFGCIHSVYSINYTSKVTYGKLPYKLHFYLTLSSRGCQRTRNIRTGLEIHTIINGDINRTLFERGVFECSMKPVIVLRVLWTTVFKLNTLRFSYELLKDPTSQSSLWHVRGYRSELGWNRINIITEIFH